MSEEMGVFHHQLLQEHTQKTSSQWTLDLLNLPSPCWLAWACTRVCTLFSVALKSTTPFCLFLISLDGFFAGHPTLWGFLTFRFAPVTAVTLLGGSLIRQSDLPL